MLFAKKINVDINRVNDCINIALKRGIFNQELFNKYNILTSRGIQKRFLEAAKRRKQIEMIEGICLIDFDIDYYKDLKPKIVFVSNNLINVNNNSINVCKSTQIEREREKEIEKEIESSSNEKKINVSNNGKNETQKSEIAATATNDINIFSYYEKNITSLTDEAKQLLKQYLDIMNKELIQLIIDEAVNSNVKTLNYIKAILVSCEKEKIYTVEQFKKRQKNFEENRKQHQKQTKRTETEQREYPENFFNSFCANLNDKGTNNERDTT